MDQHAHLCLKNSEELKMDAALVTCPPSFSSQQQQQQHHQRHFSSKYHHSTHQFQATTIERGSHSSVGLVSLFSHSDRHVNTRHPPRKKGTSSLSSLQARVSHALKSDLTMDDPAASMIAMSRTDHQHATTCPCYLLRRAYSKALEEWSCEQGACCTEECRGLCSSCSVLVVGSNVFLAQTGSLRVFRSSRNWKKLNVTHDGPPFMHDLDFPRLVEFKIESDRAFILVVSESVTRRISSMEAFDIVRASLLKHACAKSAAEALLETIKDMEPLYSHQQDDAAADHEMAGNMDLLAMVVHWTPSMAQAC